MLFLRLKHVICICALVFFFVESHASVPPEVKRKFRQIIRLINEDNVNELSQMVSYPLKRSNPLPDIANAKEFVAYYKTLIDDNFKQKLKRYNDTDVFEHHGEFGLVGGVFNGDMWLDEDGKKVIGINYSSKREQELRAQLTRKIQKEIYPGINSWKENIVVATSPRLLIRVDYTKKGLRYVCWSKGRPISAKPDIVLDKGVAEAQGTQGGWTWTFKNGDWTYVVDDAEMCETADECGLFLRILFKDVEKSSVKLKEIK